MPYRNQQGKCMPVLSYQQSQHVVSLQAVLINLQVLQLQAHNALVVYTRLLVNFLKSKAGYYQAHTIFRKHSVYLHIAQV